MHTSESRHSKLYQPRTLFDPHPNANTASRALPESLRESLKAFLRLRSELLMSSQDLDRKTYSDHPQPHELSDGESDSEVCVPHFYDDIGWPHKWSSLAYRPSGTDPSYQAMLRLDALHKSLRHDEPEVAAVVKNLSESLYWSSSLSIWLRVRAPKNEYGVCVEDIEPKRLRERLPEDIAQFVAVAHNALIDVLGWLDQDLERRKADANESMRLFARRNELAVAERRLQERETRHKKAVARHKADLAKRKDEAAVLMEAANRRMAEAMKMAELAARA